MNEMHFAVAAHRPAHKQIVRALVSLSSAMLLMRVMGMLNQIVVTARFGAGAAMDAYFVAILLPLTLAQLVVDTIENSFIPAYLRARARGPEESAALFSTLLNLLVIGAGVFMLLMLLFRRQVIFLSAPALDPSRAGQAVDLLPFILPAFALTIVIGLLECIFNIEGQFGWPAYAGMLVPFCTIILVLAAGASLGVLMLCVGMVVGLCLQLGLFIVRARRARLVYRPVMRLRQPELGLTLLIAWPALLGSIFSQISPLVDQMFASSLSAGSISALNYALKLISVPSGVIAFSVGRAIAPHLSQQVVSQDMKAFKETLRLYVWAVGLGITALSAFMLVFAHPLVQLFFQRGQFTAENTSHTATTLIGFVVGLPAMALVFVLVKAFTALGKTRVLMMMGLFNLVANAIFDAIFARLWQSEGIALATSAMYFLGALIMLLTLRLMIGNIHLWTPPPELFALISLSPGGRRAPVRFLRRAWHPFTFTVFPRLRQYLLRAGVIGAVFAAGVAAVVLNYVYALRLALGAVVIPILLRYQYVLLLAWAALAALIGSSISLFQGHNFTSGLILPTMLVMPTMPLLQTLKRMRALIFFLLLLVWMFASIGVSSIGPVPFLTQWTIYLSFLAAAVLAINLLTTERRLVGVIDAMLLSAVFVSLYGIAGYFTRQHGLPDTTVGFRIFSVFGSSSALGWFLSLIIPLALYRALTVRGVRRIICLLVLGILLTALGLTFARSAFVSVFASILLTAFFLPSRKMKIGVLGSFVALALLTVLLTFFGAVPFLSRFFEQDVTTLNGRTDIWRILMSQFDPTKLLGSGLNASGILLASLHVNAVKGVTVTSYEAHNLFLAILFDHGFIGLFLLILVYLALLVGLIAGLRKAAGAHRLLFAVALAAFICTVLQSFESTDLFSLGIGLYFWVIMALPFARCWPGRSP